MKASLNVQLPANNTTRMYSSDHGNTAKHNGASQESFQERPSTSAGLTTRESVELFQEAVDTAHDEYQRTLFGSDTTGEALKPKLTVDLRHRGLSQLPREIIAIIKQNVERYDKSTAKVELLLTL